MKHISTLFALTLLVVPSTVFAEVPAVQGVDAEQRGSNVVVEWDALSGDIAYYRVYHSTESILDNDGLFDDFEVTDGDETQLEIVPRSGSTMFYAAVIGVATDGSESEYFTEEAVVQLQANAVVPEPTSEPEPIEEEPVGPEEPDAPEVPEPTSEDVSEPVVEPDSEPAEGMPAEADEPSVLEVPEVPEPTLGPVQLLRGESISPTEMYIEFSATLTVEPEKAPDGLTITDREGNQLQILSITINGPRIAINTAAQTKGMVYNVEFKEPFVGKSGQPLDATARSVFVTGHPDGKDAEPTSAPTPSTDPLVLPDVGSVTMTPQPLPNGTYLLTIEWDPTTITPDVMYYAIYQTRDGQNFAQPSVLPANIRGVQLPGVTPGFYGVYIQTVNAHGIVSTGVFQHIMLSPVVPGQGLGATVTQQVAAEETVAEETEFVPEEGFEVIEAVTEDASADDLAFVLDKPAAETTYRVNWKNAAILAASIAGLFVLFMGTFIVARPRRSRVE